MDKRFQFVERGVTYGKPGREGVAKAGVRPYVLDLLGHPGQHKEDEVVERVLGIEVTRLAIEFPQPSLDLSNPTYFDRR